MIGGTLIQTIILLWVTFRTDWNKEVNLIFLFLIFFSIYTIFFLFFSFWDKWDISLITNHLSSKLTYIQKV